MGDSARVFGNWNNWIQLHRRNIGTFECPTTTIATTNRPSDTWIIVIEFSETWIANKHLIFLGGNLSIGSKYWMPINSKFKPT